MRKQFCPEIPPEDEVPDDAEGLYQVDENGKVIPIIRYEEGDEPIHTVEYPYCGNPNCICGGSPPSEASQ